MMQTKFFTWTKGEINKAERTITHVITTEVLDRDKEIVLASGGKFENYRRNPVVLFAHDHSGTPIGKNLWIRPSPDGRGLMAKTQFATTPKAEEIYSLFCAEMLNGFSIGFLSNSKGLPTEKELRMNPGWREARSVVRDWELLEYSAVPLPCNPEALARSIKSRSLRISENLAKELLVNYPYPPSTFTPRPVPVLTAEEFEKAFNAEFRRAAKKMVKKIRKQIPGIVAERFHIAKGGV